MNGKNVETVVEIAAKFAFGDESSEVSIGGGDHANVDAQSAIAAEALELLFLEYAKEFGLKFERKVTDFIEKEGAAIRKFEAANFLRDRTGEGAAFVAKQFGFKEAGRDGGAIDFDEGALAARAEVVDGASNELLAGAGFAENEDGGVGGSREFDLGKSTPEELAIADDFLEVEFAANLLFEVQFFDGEFVFEAIDLLEGESVFERDGNLTADLLKELDIESGERIRIAAGKIDGAEGALVGDQGHAAENLHALVVQETADLGLKAIDFLAARDQDLAGGDGVSGRGAVDGDGKFGFGCSGGNRNIEGVNLEQTGSLIHEREAGVVVLNDGLERRNDALEKSGDVASAAENIVDL